MGTILEALAVIKGKDATGGAFDAGCVTTGNYIGTYGQQYIGTYTVCAHGDHP